MSTTMSWRRTPRPEDDEGHADHPLKGLFARRFLDHDGSLGGEVTILLEDRETVAWLEGLAAGGVDGSGDLLKHLRKHRSLDVRLES